MKRYFIHKMNSSPIILAIAPGTREFGIAVFNGIELTYYSVKTLNPKDDILNQISELLTGLITWFSPQIIVIKSINKYQKLASNLENIINHIKFVAEQKGLEIFELTFEQIKDNLCDEEKTAKRKAFESLLFDYPQLNRFWNRPNKWQNDYYSFMFSAVAVGVVFLKLNSRM